MEKLLAALGIAGVLLPTVGAVADSLGSEASVGVQIAGVAVVAATKAVVDVKTALEKRKEKKVRQRAARRQ